MPDIRYVCLSDLHFGAENSLLSRLVDGAPVVDPAAASAVLDGLTDGLSALIDANERKVPKPTLILNGDVLELALASDNVALMVFELFLDRIFPEGGEALFDDTILYVPGNHDHHLWETARETQYADLIGTLAPGGPLPIPRHTTRLYPSEDEPPFRSRLLEQLAHRRRHREGIKFRVSYPNLGIRSDDGRTSIVFHHGHNLESIYQLMSAMKDVIFPGRRRAVDVSDMEAENFAWIDFFWSTLGRSGQVGEDVGLIYDMLQSPEAIRTLAGNMAAGLAARLPRRHMLGFPRWLVRPALAKAVELVATRVADRERKKLPETGPPTMLSPDAEAGLMAYLSGPMISQLATESQPMGPLPEQVKFVFGHTHKPFVGTRDVPGLTNPVRIFNTGGWVVDTLSAEPRHGVNMALIDENLEVACVRMYNQSADPVAYRVSLDSGLAVEQGPFYRRLSALLNPDDNTWKAFSTAAARLVVERQGALQSIIAGGAQPPTPTVIDLRDVAGPTVAQAQLVD